jgi:SNW domain-containing protein 1
LVRRKDDSNTKSSRVQTLALTTDASGKVRHDAVVKQQHGAGTLVQSSHTDLLSKKFTEEQLMKPSEEEVEAKADETREALEALLQGKTGGGKVQSQVRWVTCDRAFNCVI